MNAHKARANERSAYITTLDSVGKLAEISNLFKKYGINLTKIESSHSSSLKGGVDFHVDFYLPVDLKNGAETKFIEDLVNDLEKSSESVTVGSVENLDNTEKHWFPKTLQDIDKIQENISAYGAELDADHPGFKDVDYVKRRKEIAQIAKNYKCGQPIPRIDYSPLETETWAKVYNGLKALYPTHACEEHQRILPILEEKMGYGPNAIPQLEDVNKALKQLSGFQVRPVMGLLSVRDFLNALAFGVFHSTQYIRHSSLPLYTPEPDACHDLIGHVPLLADPKFARWTQELGLATLGASDADLNKLATLYWYTVEFGLCKQNNTIRAFGAGLLSSFGELEYCLSDKPQKMTMVLEEAAVKEYPITEYQPVYFVSESFDKMREQFAQFAAKVSENRGFSVRYNAYTQSVEVLDCNEKIEDLVAEIGYQTNLLQQAMRNLNKSTHKKK